MSGLARYRVARDVALEAGDLEAVAAADRGAELWHRPPEEWELERVDLGPWSGFWAALARQEAQDAYETQIIYLPATTWRALNEMQADASNKLRNDEIRRSKIGATRLSHSRPPLPAKPSRVPPLPQRRLDGRRAKRN